MNATSTKKVKRADRDTMRHEYRPEEIRLGVRGKYFKRYRAGTNLVLLDPDVSKAWPSAELVNATLRKAMRAAKRLGVPIKTSRVRSKTRKPT